MDLLQFARNVFFAGFALLLLYSFLVRPWLLRWGSTSLERTKPLPGDLVVAQANSTCTRAITIQASPERVWPWLVQIGQGRGGFYSYAWLENLFGCEIVNADTIHPEWQDLKAGEGIRLHPMVALPVAVLEVNRALVLGGPGIPAQRIPPTSWAFVLEAAPGNASRLLVRWRSHTPHTFLDLLLNRYALEPIHFTMERRMMLGIRERAESAAPEPPSPA
jgi:hypothetical protein